jgi:hypothetical protein
LPAALLSLFVGALTGLVRSLSALPLALTYSLSSLLPDIVGMPTDPAAMAGAIVAVTGAYARAIVDGTVPMQGDPSGGLAGLATWGDDILAVGCRGRPTLALQAANALATVDLVRGSAVAAVAEVYAGTEWTSADAAAATCDQLAAMIDNRAMAAAAAGQDALYSSWQALASVASQDLALRAQQLPRLGSYTRQSPPPTLSLAYRLYQDAGRATQLVALNDAPHPLFMPLAGKALAV